MLVVEREGAAFADRGLGVASAAAGVAGGLALGSKLAPRRRVLGIPVPRRRVGLDDVAKQVGRAGQQFRLLRQEIKKTREKAERVVDALS
jgi:hypothetical protein